MIRIILILFYLINPIKTSETLIKEVERVLSVITVVATCYYPIYQKANKTCYITSNGAKINKTHPIQHRWVAVSRDLLKSHVKYGDTINIHGTDIYDGKWVVMDKMNKRFKKRIDFLVNRSSKIAKWDKVQIRLNN